MDTHKAAESTASLTPQTIIACVGLVVALPSTLAVLIQWYRRSSAPWKCCMGRLHGVHRNSDGTFLLHIHFSSLSSDTLSLVTRRKCHLSLPGLSRFYPCRIAWTVRTSMIAFKFEGRNFFGGYRQVVARGKSFSLKTLSCIKCGVYRWLVKPRLLLFMV
jgi:hypothetical protein